MHPNTANTFSSFSLFSRPPACSSLLLPSRSRPLALSLATCHSNPFGTRYRSSLATSLHSLHMRVEGEKEKRSIWGYSTNRPKPKEILSVSGASPPQRAQLHPRCWQGFAQGTPLLISPPLNYRLSFLLCSHHASSNAHITKHFSAISHRSGWKLTLKSEAKTSGRRCGKHPAKPFVRRPLSATTASVCDAPSDECT